MKLHVLLAKVDHSGTIFKKLITEYVSFFKNKQKHFQGIRKTYTPREGQLDNPSMKGNTIVTTTVEEHFKWMEETSKEYIDDLFSVEATNASGLVAEELIVDGISFGKLSSLELLRLNSFLETKEFDEVYVNIPVRSDAEIWTKSKDELYAHREVYEKELERGVTKTTIKEPYILKDPNIDPTNAATAARYTPQVVARENLLELGDYTTQHFKW
jgi:hypothetical protein